MFSTKRIVGSSALVVAVLTAGTMPAGAATKQPATGATAAACSTGPATSTDTSSAATITAPDDNNAAAGATSSDMDGTDPAGTATPTSTATPAGAAATTVAPVTAAAASPDAGEAGALPAAAAATSVAACPPSNRSGLPWPSGVFVPGDDPTGVEQFAAWRGRPVDVAVTWPARQTWDDVINPQYVFSAWKGTPYRMALGIAPVPEGDGSATMAGCAAGAYNDKWLQFGHNMVNGGMGNAIIRLGWEFNGDWYKWSASNPQEFAQCWRQIVGTVRTVAPDLVWDWTVNRGVSAGLGDATQAYPGDDYVDYVGVDSYDAWPGATSEEAWDQQYNGEFGLKFWADFASAHGKKLSVPEWGNYPGTAASGGDDPFYIDKMEDFFASEGSNLAYESYFNESAAYYAGAIFAPVEVPAASSEYLKRMSNP